MALEDERKDKLEEISPWNRPSHTINLMTGKWTEALMERRTRPTVDQKEDLNGSSDVTNHTFGLTARSSSQPMVRELSQDASEIDGLQSPWKRKAERPHG